MDKNRRLLLSEVIGVPVICIQKIVPLILVLSLSGAARTIAQEPPTILLAASPNDSATSALYAIRAGLFKNAGLNVTLNPMNSGAAVAAGVAGGSIQIGASSMLGLIVAHTKQVPFTLVSGSVVYDQVDKTAAQLVVRKDSPLRTAHDLNGKIIAVPALKDLNTISSMAWMDQNGGDSSTVRYIELSPAASLQALVDGRIDATILAMPVLAEGLHAGTIRSFGDAYGSIGKEFLVVGWFANQDYATKNPDVIARFARVMRQAALYCNAHPADTVDMIADFAKLDPAAVRGMVRERFATNLNPALIRPVIDAAAKYKVIDHAFDPADLIDPNATLSASR